jgi:hypothetical protein
MNITQEEELSRFKRINGCETAAELAAAILEFADPETGMIKGRTRDFSATNMASYVMPVVASVLPANALTREYGIRQQALYIIHYGKN